MRKLLMASAAIMGASGGLALAQTAPIGNVNQGTAALPYAGGPSYANFANVQGSLQNQMGSAAAGGLSSMSYYGPGVYTLPTPGTVVIRLGGKVEADIGVGFTSLSSIVGVGTTGGTSLNGTAAGQNVAGVKYKTNPVAIGSYMRLYPGFDGMTTNGIRYGAQIELRENFQPSQTAMGTPAAPSVVTPSGNTSAQTVMVRRAFTYIASDQFGIVRLGQGDGVIGLFDPCIFAGQCWDAGVGVFQNNFFGGFFPINSTGGGATNYPWLSQAGAEYGNEKIVYLTPQIFGFDFAAQYAPGMGNAYADSAGGVGYPATVGNTTVVSDAEETLTSGATQNRWYNEMSVGARYMQTFGAVDFKAYAAWIHAAHEGSVQPITASFNPINLYQAAAAVTTAGLTASITYQWGNVNNQLALNQVGAAHMSAPVIGLTYINGPWTAGISAATIDAQGNAGALVGYSQRHQAELALGGNYKLAPGINLVLEYSYYATHQGGFNFATNTATKTSAYNDVKGQGLVFTTMLTW